MKKLIKISFALLILLIIGGCANNQNPEFTVTSTRIGKGWDTPGDHSTVSIYISEKNISDSSRLFRVRTSFHEPEFLWCQTLTPYGLPKDWKITFIALQSDEYDDENLVEYFTILGPGEWETDSIAVTVLTHHKGF